MERKTPAFNPNFLTFIEACPPCPFFPSESVNANAFSDGLTADLMTLDWELEIVYPSVCLSNFPLTSHLAGD